VAGAWLLSACALGEGAEAPSEENAAVWYERAVASFEAPPGALRQELLEVVERGWTDAHPALVAFLRQNAQALDEIKTGARLAACDFFKGQPLPPFYPQTVLPHPHPPTFMWLVRTMLLEGREYERRGVDAAALQNYLLALRAASHWSRPQHPLVLEKLYAMIYQEIASHPLEQLIRRSTLSAQQWHEALAALRTMQPLWEEAGLAQAYETEQTASVREALEAWLNARPRERDHVAQFRDACDRLVGEYHRLLREAMQQCAAPEAVERLSAFVDQLGQGAVQPVSVSDPRQELRRLFSGSSDLTAESQARRFLALMLPSGAPGVIRRCCIARTRINLLVGAVGLRLHALQRGAPPSTLDQLVPAWLPRLPEDPFGDGAPLRYRREPEGWMLYSLGPDRVDQQGSVALSPEQFLSASTGLEPGDIVFSAQPTQ
jgi:hypothetical protein